MIMMKLMIPGETRYVHRPGMLNTTVRTMICLCLPKPEPLRGQADVAQAGGRIPGKSHIIHVFRLPGLRFI